MATDTPPHPESITADRPTTESKEASPSGNQSNPLWKALWIRAQILFWVFLVYCLSLGPMYWTWYQSKYIGGSPWVAVFYEPLLRLTAIPLFRDWINWYLSFWG